MSADLTYPVTDTTQAACQFKTPVYLLGLGVALMKQHFGNQNRLTLDKSSFIYTDDLTDPQSALGIGHRDNLNFESMGKRPYIIVDLGEISFPKSSINEHMGWDDSLGTTYFIEYVKASWVFNCLSPKPLEAWALAGEVKYFLQTYHKMIAGAYCLDELKVAAISGYAKIPDYEEIKGVSVIVNLSFQQNYGVTIDQLKLSAINLQLQPI